MRRPSVIAISALLGVIAVGALFAAFTASPSIPGAGAAELLSRDVVLRPPTTDGTWAVFAAQATETDRCSTIQLPGQPAIRGCSVRAGIIKAWNVETGDIDELIDDERTEDWDANHALIDGGWVATRSEDIEIATGEAVPLPWVDGARWFQPQARTGSVFFAAGATNVTAWDRSESSPAWRVVLPPDDASPIVLDADDEVVVLGWWHHARSRLAILSRTTGTIEDVPLGPGEAPEEFVDPLIHSTVLGGQQLLVVGHEEARTFLRSFDRSSLEVAWERTLPNMHGIVLTTAQDRWLASLANSAAAPLAYGDMNGETQDEASGIGEAVLVGDHIVFLSGRSELHVVRIGAGVGVATAPLALGATSAVLALVLPLLALRASQRQERGLLCKGCQAPLTNTLPFCPNCGSDR